jgi:hypothetical protein
MIYHNLLPPYQFRFIRRVHSECDFLISMMVTPNVCVGRLDRAPARRKCERKRSQIRGGSRAFQIKCARSERPTIDWMETFVLSKKRNSCTYPMRRSRIRISVMKPLPPNHQKSVRILYIYSDLYTVVCFLTVFLVLCLQVGSTYLRLNSYLPCLARAKLPTAVSRPTYYLELFRPAYGWLAPHALVWQPKVGCQSSRYDSPTGTNYAAVCGLHTKTSLMSTVESKEEESTTTKVLQFLS